MKSRKTSNFINPVIFSFGQTNKSLIALQAQSETVVLKNSGNEWDIVINHCICGLFKSPFSIVVDITTKIT